MLYYLKGMKFNASDADIEMYILVAVTSVLPEKKNMSQPPPQKKTTHTMDPLMCHKDNRMRNKS